MFSILVTKLDILTKESLKDLDMWARHIFCNFWTLTYHVLKQNQMKTCWFVLSFKYLVISL
jgi:hypothetical protein